MQNTERLTYPTNITEESLNELWQNCFEGVANQQHINAYVPYPITRQATLNQFLLNQNGYRVWFIKRLSEADIIGFLIHGDFFPGHPNNIGFNIGFEYTNRGYAREALGALVEQLRLEGLTETSGHCFETNVASIHTMEGCGFVNLGRTGREYFGNHEIQLHISL